MTGTNPILETAFKYAFPQGEPENLRIYSVPTQDRTPNLHLIDMSCGPLWFGRNQYRALAAAKDQGAPAMVLGTVCRGLHSNDNGTSSTSPGLLFQAPRRYAGETIRCRVFLGCLRSM